jgi:hypothetical protein
MLRSSQAQGISSLPSMPVTSWILFLDHPYMLHFTSILQVACRTLRDLPSKHNGDNRFFSDTHSTRSDSHLENFKPILFSCNISSRRYGSSASMCVCAGQQPDVSLNGLVTHEVVHSIRLPAMQCFRWLSICPCCLPVRREEKSWRFGWMDEFGNLCERVLCRPLVSRWIPWIDAILPSSSFSPQQSGCPTGFYIHSTWLQHVSFDFDVVRILFLCP